MDTNAPEHVIGTGSLEVKPKMEAVEQAFDKIERRLDSIKEKFDKLFDVDSLRRFSAAIDSISDKLKGLNFSDATDKLKSDIGEVVEQIKGARFDAPRKQEGGEDNDSKYRSMIESARNQQHCATVENLLTEISSKLDNIQAEQASD